MKERDIDYLDQVGSIHLQHVVGDIDDRCESIVSAGHIGVIQITQENNRVCITHAIQVAVVICACECEYVRVNGCLDGMYENDHTLIRSFACLLAYLFIVHDRMIPVASMTVSEGNKYDMGKEEVDCAKEFTFSVIPIPSVRPTLKTCKPTTQGVSV